MSKEIMNEIEKRLAYIVAKGNASDNAAAVEHAITVCTEGSGTGHTAVISGLRSEAGGKFAPEEIMMQLVRPYGIYTENPDGMPREQAEFAADYLKHIWKALHLKYVSKDQSETDAAFARQPFAGLCDMTSDIFEIVNYAHEHGVKDEEIIDTLITG